MNLFVFLIEFLCTEIAFHVTRKPLFRSLYSTIFCDNFSPSPHFHYNYSVYSLSWVVHFDY